MPSTITSYYTFVPSTKARSSQVNTNFSNYRGTIVPINEATATASDSTHDLGAPDHYWRVGYLNNVNLKSSTTTAQTIIRADTSATAGAFLFDINSVTVMRVNPNGISNISLEATARTIIGVTITSTQVWTVPAGVTQIFVEACGGGGGGGAGAGDTGTIGRGGGSGGNGAYVLTKTLNVTPLEVLSITVGTGGAGGGATTGAGPNGANGTATTIARSGTTILYAHPGLGGLGSNTTITGASANNTTSGIYLFNFSGGAGANYQNSATSGSPSLSIQLGGLGGGSTTTGGGGGGGGGSSYGQGSNGANGTQSGNVPANTNIAGYGAGGGGGGGHGAGGSPNNGGAGGAGGAGIVILTFTKTT